MKSTILEIAGIRLHLTAPAGSFSEKFTREIEPPESDSHIEIDLEVEFDTDPGESGGFAVSFGDDGILRFSARGFNCKIDTEKGRGVLRTVRDDSAMEYIFKTIFSTLLLNKSGSIMHAAGLERGGRGYLFAGAPGAGKSTVARIAGGAARVINDEHVAVRRRGDGFVIYPLPEWAAGTTRRDPGARPAPLAACFALSHGAATGFDPGSPAFRSKLMFENICFILPEKQVLESAMRFAEELQKSIPTALLALSLDDSERFWDVIDGYLGNEI